MLIRAFTSALRQHSLGAHHIYQALIQGVVLLRHCFANLATTECDKT